MIQTSANLAWLIALPLFSSAILLLIGRRANSWGHVMACIVSASTFTIGLVEFFAMQSRSEENRAVTQSYLPGFQLVHLTSMRHCF